MFVCLCVNVYVSIEVVGWSALVIFSRLVIIDPPCCSLVLFESFNSNSDIGVKHLIFPPKSHDDGKSPSIRPFLIAFNLFLLCL